LLCVSKAAESWERWSAWSPGTHPRTTGRHSPPGPQAWAARRDPNRIRSRQASVSLSGHGPSLVRGPRRNKGQPRIITDTNPAAPRLSGSSAETRSVAYNDEITPELPRRVRGLPTSRWSPGTGLTLRSAWEPMAPVCTGSPHGRATSLPFTTVLTGPERTTTDNATAHSTSALPLPHLPR
jgi:hypothetical protein